MISPFMDVITDQKGTVGYVDIEVVIFYSPAATVAPAGDKKKSRKVTRVYINDMESFIDVYEDTTSFHRRITLLKSLLSKSTSPTEQEDEPDEPEKPKMEVVGS